MAPSFFYALVPLTKSTRFVFFSTVIPFARTLSLRCHTVRPRLLLWSKGVTRSVSDEVTRRPCRMSVSPWENAPHGSENKFP